MTLNYWVIVERHTFSNGAVANLRFDSYCEIFSLLDEKTLASLVGSQEPTHRKVGIKPHPTPEDS